LADIALYTVALSVPHALFHGKLAQNKCHPFWVLAGTMIHFFNNFTPSML